MSMFRSLLMASNGSSPTPPVPSNPYKPITCLNITDPTGSYIDIDIPWQWNLKFEFDIQPVLYRTNYTTLAAGTTNTGYNRFGYNSEGKAPDLDLYYILKNGRNHSANISGLDNIRNKYIFTLKEGNSKGYVESVSSVSVTCTYTITESNKTRLWANDGTGGDRYRGKIYGVKIYDTTNDSLICDLVPYLRVEDSVAGLYDKVYDKFYTSQSSIPFLYEE